MTPPPAISAALPGSDFPAMADLRSRDPRVLNAAWEKAWPLLWAHALGRLRHAWQRGLWDRLDLESCAAEAIRSLTAGVAGQPGGDRSLTDFPSLRNAATRRAWRRSVDAWRRLGRPARHLFPDGGGEGAGWTNPDPEYPPPAPATHHDLQVVLDFIRAWPGPRREIFLLTYIDGLNSRETAEALGLTGTNVRTHLFRGREELWLAFPGLFEPRRPAEKAAVPGTAEIPSACGAAAAVLPLIPACILFLTFFFLSPLA